MKDTLKYTEKLTGNNYPVWKVRMSVLLVSKGLRQVADPTVDDKHFSDRKKSEKALA